MDDTIQSNREKANQSSASQSSQQGRFSQAAINKSIRVSAPQPPQQKPAPNSQPRLIPKPVELPKKEEIDL